MAIDNTLLGSYDKEGSKVKRAVYRVKNSDNDDYTRIHFETSSQMIHDATHTAAGDKVARRDKYGNIMFHGIDATSLTKTNTLEVVSTSSLNGKTTIGTSVANNSVALEVPANKNTSLGGTLSVAGTSAFTGKTTHSNGAEIKNGATISTGDLTVSEGKLTVAKGGATITGTLTANDSMVGNSTLTVKGKTTLGQGVADNTTALEVLAKKNTSLGGTLVVSGTSTFNSKTTHEAEATVKGALSVEAKSGGAAGNLSVAGNSNLTGTLGVGGATTLSSTLTTQGATTLNSSLTTKGNTSLEGTLGVKSTTTLGNTLTVAGNTALNNALTVAGAETVNGVFTVNNNSTLGKSDNSNTTTINGTAAINKITVKDSGLVTNLNADKVDGCDVDNTKTTDAHLWTAKKIDDTKANKSTKISAGTAISITGGTLGVDNTISHSNISRGADATGNLGTSGTVCNVVSAVASNTQGHVTGATVVNLDNRYYTRDLTDQEIENRINNVVGNDVILKNPSSGTVNGTNLKMDGFTMQFNKTANAIEFVFV